MKPHAVARRTGYHAVLARLDLFSALCKIPKTFDISGEGKFLQAAAGPGCLGGEPRAVRTATPRLSGMQKQQQEAAPTFLH